MTTTPDTLAAHDPDDPMVRSGARWCGEHGWWECVAKKPNHHAPAVRGNPHCRFHLGKKLDLAKTQGEANLAAWSAQAAAEAGLVQVDPGQAVMDQLRVAAIRADVYGELLRLQVADQEVDGLVGPTYTAGRDGQRVETGEQVRALVRLEAEWRDRVVRFAKTAHDMGIAERVVELQQSTARRLFEAYVSSLEAVPELLPAQKDAMLRAFLAGIGVEVGHTGPDGSGVGVLDAGGGGDV